MLGLNPSQHDLVDAAVTAAVSTGSSAFPRMVLPDSPDASACNPVPGFHVYAQPSRLSWECSPEVSVVAPSTPVPIDLNATPVAVGSSTGGARKRAPQTRADQLLGARNLFDGMPAAGDDDYMQNMIFEGGAQAAGFDPNKTQSQDGRGAFTPPAGYNEDHAAFMRDQVGLDLDDFPLDHEFPEDYGVEEEDECDIEAEPLFEDELANQADGTKLKRKSKRTKAYTAVEDKLLCECWRDIGQDPKTCAEQKHSTFWIRVHREFHERKKFSPYQIVSTCGWVSISKCWRVIQQECNKFCATLESVKARPMSGIGMQDMAFQALEAFKVQHNGKCFNLSHCFRVIKDEEKFKAQYVALKSHGRKQAVKEVGDGEKAGPRGKTNSKKEDKRDVRDRGRQRQDQGQRSGSCEHDDRDGDHEGGSQHRVAKEEAMAREDQLPSFGKLQVVIDRIGSFLHYQRLMATGGVTLESLPNELPLDFLNKITRNFSDELLLGQGAFGSVYKGILDDGGVVAVKKLAENSPVPRDTIFVNEVQNIMVLEHENIVKLVAYCREAQKKLVQSNGRYIIAEVIDTVLCYEYLPKGSLHNNLFGESGSIDWDTRFKIIKGICEGIHFLHTLPSPVLHLGLKPQNILLGDNMKPKIADFGFSRIFGQDQTRKNTRSVVGSVGYMAPEYLYNGEISARSDIYSLGLIIMEISTREMNSSSTDQKHARKYIDGVKENWTLEKIMSEYIELEEHAFDQVEACINIGLQCVEIDQKKRPSIETIVNMLNKLPVSEEVSHSM
ncbi:Cysteine-rich receptor-like protein kinase 10 [Hordeum vulgare]|nr:Cysteine-rich receptor-like protein kinase 10 [Hordeum vulgare]